MHSPHSNEFRSGAELLAAVFDEGVFRLKPMRVPSLQAGELLLRVAAVGICGTDLKIAAGRKQPKRLPSGDVILGHEVVGEVVAAGGDAQAHVGRLVMVEPDIYCGECRYCRAGATNMCSDPKVIFEDYPGAFSQFLLVPAKAVSNGQVHELPAAVTAEIGTLLEPLACVIHGQARLLRLLPVRGNALILGGGPIGTMHALLARVHGFEQIVIADVNPERVALLGRVLARFPEIRCVQIGSALELGEIEGRTFDMVVQACPDVSALQTGFGLVAPSGGLLAFAGVSRGDTFSVDAHRLHYKDIHIIGSANYLTSDVRTALELLESGRVPGELLVSQRFPLTRIQEAISHAQSGRALKLVLNPN